MSEPNAQLRKLPAVDRITTELSGPHNAVVAAARRAIDDARKEVRAGALAPGFDALVATARSMLVERQRKLLTPVINATGVLIHTNLGRVPLGAQQLDAVRRVAAGYSNLEYDLDAGARGSRYEHAQTLVNELTGSDAALVVNNNAAAVLLVLASLARGKEVIISRGELVEIGGEFRIPEVMAAAGVKLVEIGTTNRTHLSDYERAITPDTAAILKVHPSNYRVVGFVSEVAARDVARVALARKVCFIHDLGSGLFGEPPGGTGDEPAVDVALEEGADVVTFSGDKLLGGPQAGIIAGRAHLIAKMSKNALLRALRVDKMTLAALEATLQLYLEGRRDELPFWAMAGASSEELERRAARIAAQLQDLPAKVEAVALAAMTGGGSMPGVELGSWGLAITPEHATVDEIERTLRAGNPPVIARVEDERVLLDVRTVAEEQDPELVRALRASLVSPSA
ncbi:MAG: L-seryl-tRNA(Sec) selenium transferase [Actinomycetota bacterium]